MHVPERRDELSTMLDAQEGALELCRGGIHRAAVAFRHGSAGVQRGNGSAAGYDCLGQRALLGAFQGELRVAERHAAPVLKNTAAGGLAHAHLATAWVHLERAEPTPARQHLDRAVEASENQADPWFVLVQLIAEARLLEDDQRARGRAEAAASGVERGAGRRSVGMAGRPAHPRLCRDVAGCGGAAPGPRPGDSAATRCGSRGRSAGSVRALRAWRCRSCLRCADLGGRGPRWSPARRAGRLLDARGAAGARCRTAGPGTRPGGPRTANCRRGDASTTVRSQGDVAGRRSSRRTRRCAGHTVVSSPGSGLRRSATRRG